MTSTPPGPAGLRKRVILALVIVGLIVAPALIMILVTWVGTGELQAAATWASIPAIAGFAAVAAGGRRFALIVAFVMGFLGSLTIVAGLSPVSGAALMALLCMMVGRLSRFGLHKSALLVPVMLSWSLIDPPTWTGQSTVDRLDTGYLLWMTLIFFIGALFPVLVGPFILRKRHFPPPQPHSVREAVPYTVMITVLVATASYYVLDSPTRYGGAFLIAGILVLAPIGPAQTLRQTIWRVLGTLLGTVFVIAIVSEIQSLTLVYVVGLVMITIALAARFGPHAWVYYVFMMPATACLNATSLTEVGQLGKQRAIDNVIAGVLVLIATAVTIGYSRWADQHGHATNDDPEIGGKAGVPSLTAVAS